MQHPPLTLFAKLRQGASTLAVLAGLGALAYFGQRHHWKIPKFSELIASAPAGADDGPAAAKNVKVDWPKDGAADSPLAVVIFPRADSVAKCGITSVKVAERNIAETITAAGVIDYDQQEVAHLSTRVPGTVWRVEKQVGEPIKKGETLAIIESAEVGKAKAAFLQAIAQVHLRDHLLELAQSVATVVSGRRLKESEAELQEARINLYNAQQALINLHLPVQAADFDKLTEEEMVKRIQFLGLPEAIASALDPKTTTANLLPIISPFDGIVIGRDATLGEVVSPDKSQFVVVDNSRMWILLDVRKEDGLHVHLGQEVAFQPDGFPGEVRSKISWISTDVDEKTRTISVRADVINPDNPNQNAPGGSRLLRANSFGVGRITVRQSPKALSIPAVAVQTFDNRPMVFVQHDERTFVARPVQTGARDGRYVEIREGIPANATIAAVGSYLLKAEMLRTRPAAP